MQLEKSEFRLGLRNVGCRLAPPSGWWSASWKEAPHSAYTQILFTFSFPSFVVLPLFNNDDWPRGPRIKSSLAVGWIVIKTTDFCLFKRKINVVYFRVFVAVQRRQSRMKQALLEECKKKKKERNWTRRMSACLPPFVCLFFIFYLFKKYFNHKEELSVKQINNKQKD